MRRSHLSGPGTALRLLRTRGFGPYFVGNALSATGLWFQTLAAQLLVWRQTHSGLMLGVLAAAEFLPLLLLSPWAGGIADRFDRRRIIVCTQVAAVVLSGALAVLAWQGLASPAVVIVDAFGLGLANTIASPAVLALIPSLVAQEDIAAAVGLNSMTWNLARAVGPALAAVVVQTLGIAAAFGVNAGSYVLLIVGVLIVRPRPQLQRAKRAGAFSESARLLRANPRLLVLLAIVTVVGMAADPINTLSPAFAHSFGRPDTSSGVIIGVFGAGAVCAAFALSSRTAGSDRRAAFTLTTLGLGVVMFSLLPSYPLALGFLFVGGFAYLASNTSATSQLQLSVAEHERGRVMALWNVAFLGLRPFASTADGAIASAFGPRAAGVVLELPVLLCAAFLVYVLRSRRTVPAQAPSYTRSDV